MDRLLFLIGTVFLLQTSCASNDDSTSSEATPSPENQAPNASSENVSVTMVTTSGNENNYSFSVTISSVETGCDQFADWWEVITEDGALISRRILLHSHVNEQPFTRSNNGIQITEDQVVIIRAHMNNSGYGTEAFKGSVASGFTPTTLVADFASELASQEPLPTGCAF